MKTLRKITHAPMIWGGLLVVSLGLAVALKLTVKAQGTSGGGTLSSAGISATGSFQEDANGVYTVVSQGLDIWRTSDSFEYGYQTLNGDGQIVVRVLGISGTTNIWAKAGVMIRETLEAHSRHATMEGTVGHGLAFLWRAEPGDASGSTHGAAWTAPYWIKLVRYGNCFAGYQSQDGINWQLVDWQIVEMSQQVYVGLVSSSYNRSSACTAQFDQVQVSTVSAWDGLPMVGNGQGLRGDYFTNTDLSGTAIMVRQDRTVNFDWNVGAPMEMANPGQFSIRWTGEIQAQYSEPYTLSLETDDGVRVWLDGKQVINDWVGRYNGVSVITANLVAGQKYQLRIEYFQNGGLAHARMLWSSPSTPKRPVPQSQLYTPAGATDLFQEPQEQPTLRWAVTPNSILGGGWDHGDVGGFRTGGGADTSNGVFTVTGFGPDISGNADGFHYVYQPLTGNGQVVARVLGMAGAQPWAKAGVMIRETLDAGSKEVTLACTPANGLGFFWRPAVSNATYSSATERLDTPCWLKLVRWNDLVGGFISTNGVDWQLADVERVDMGQQVYAGLAVSSHNNKELSTAWFDQVTVSSLDTTGMLPGVGTGDGLKGQYFSNMGLTGTPTLIQTDSVVNFDWGVHPPINVPYGEHFSVRWSGEIQARFTEPCTFYLNTDDGVRVWLNENLIIDDWADRYEGESTATVNLTAGQHYLLRIEYYQNLGVSRAELSWSSPSITRQIVPQSQLYSQPTLDPDGSGLPVLWELHYFGHTGVDPNSSPAKNGLTVLQAYLDGTDPLVFSSAGDGIPDGWAVAHGLNPLDPSVATQDPDEDGLNNLQEYSAGTDPNNPCSLIPGIPDGVSVLYLQTKSAAVNTVAAANGADGQALMGQWKADGTALYALDRRGEVQWTLATSSADKFLLRVDGTQNLAGSSLSAFDLILYLDGECLGHHTLQAGYGTNGMAVCLTPYLKPGRHTVQVFWDGAASFSSLRITQVRLQSITIPNSNGNGIKNGIKDWVDRALFTESGHDGDLASGSYVSPAFVEGRDPYLSMMTLAVNGNALPVQPGAGLRWYANVPLSASTNTPVSISYQNGGEVESGAMSWLPVNVLNSSNLVIRAGDSLLLGAGSNQSTSVQITVLNGSQTVGAYTITAAQPVPCQFLTAGTYTINASYATSGGAVQNGSMTVTAVGYSFPPNPVCMTSQVRVWPLTNVPPQ